MSIETPILFCTFNRPDLTQRVFRRIASVQPQTLLISSDGPRQEVDDECRLVTASRDIACQIDWECDLRTLFSESNQGCRKQMSDAISWGFEQFEQLIIIEDDCLPSRSFFPFCRELLHRYASDARVMMISGDNFQPQQSSAFSYYFSKYAHIWGWASWRRAWEHFDLEMESWLSQKSGGLIERSATQESEQAYWTEIFERQHRGLIDTWDYSWQYACWKQGGWSILPNVNLVRNIGFDARATHTTNPSHPLANRPTESLGPISHPTVIARDTEADQYTWQNLFSHLQIDNKTSLNLQHRPSDRAA